MAKLIILNKPFQVLSQFTTDGDKRTLTDYMDIKQVYPAGRLDFDSEGMLLLTDNGQLQAQISDPRYKLTKTYWAQVEGTATQQQCDQLCRGVKLKDGPATALSCKLISAPIIWDRNPPIRVRQSIPDSWIEISIGEGRNRQVRRMTAAVNLPTLRLVRAQIGDWTLDGLQPGEYRSINVESPERAKKAGPKPKTR
ncbi:MAG: pseudouridine synthase [Porticoccaceae bacterium]|nr:pseudouridine synthase [Porticoccaceae bacterium]